MDDQVRKVWNEFRSELFGYIRSKVSDEFAAEDILQEVFLKIHWNVDRLADLTYLKGWLYRVTTNAIIDHYRRKTEELPLTQDSQDAAEDEAPENLNAEMTSCIRAMLDGLPEKYRKPLELYQLSGLSHQEISVRMSISVSASKMRNQRAREKIREMLGRCCEYEFDKYGNVTRCEQRPGGCGNSCG